MDSAKLIEKIIDYCYKNSIKKLYICGNGGAGKTTLSQKIIASSSKYGKSNLISTDDFLVDTELRKKATIKWIENKKEYCGRYTSSNKESYFLKNIQEILYNLDAGQDYFYFPKKYKEEKNIRRLYAQNFLTIIEGVGTAFLEKEKDNTLSIFLKCDKEVEEKRRIERVKENKKEIELYNEKRSSQFRVFVMPKEKDFDLIIESKDNDEYKIIESKIRF